VPRFPTRLQLAALVLAIFASGCRDRAPAAEARVVLRVGAAVSLAAVVMELDSVYRAEHPDVFVNATFASSGGMRLQIEQGAPIDVFISASERHVDALQRAGLVDARTRRVFAGNSLVLVVPGRGGRDLRGFRDLASPSVRRVAIGAAASVPAGEYAEQVLRSLGIAAVVAEKAVYGHDVRQVMSYVERGEVDAGIVYRTNAETSRAVRIVATAPPATHAPITYPLVLVSQSRNTADARAYAAFLLGPRGREALARHGLTVP
jgi:molybdate transport system substrate-binding protein